jgi:hypothetical protein
MQALLFRVIEIFGFSVVLHILVWRLFPLRQQVFRLGMIFSLGPVCLLGIHAAANRLVEGGSPIDWASWGLACLAHFSLAAVYVNLYTAVVGFSPSIGILERVERSMPGGLEWHELPPPWFSDKHLSGARRENLLATGFIHESDGFLRLTPRGEMVARSLLAFRRFLGLPDVAKG